jgi:uncharacterized pyridoxamine 5'-phosphate oxidase family protein
LGKIDRGIICSVNGCKEIAERSVSRVNASSLKLKAEGRRVYLCNKHYKELKKQVKKEKEIEKLRWK